MNQNFFVAPLPEILSPDQCPKILAVKLHVSGAMKLVCRAYWVQCSGQEEGGVGNAMQDFGYTK